MADEDDGSLFRLDRVLLAIMASMALVIAVLAFSGLERRSLQYAQVTSPQGATSPPGDPAAAPSVPAGKDNGPAESKPGGTRPTTPAPEPARPDADAQKAGATPALPAAPAEKIGEPVKK